MKPVHLTATIREVPDDPKARDLDLDSLRKSHIEASGDTYEEAHERLLAATPQGWQRLGIMRS